MFHDSFLVRSQPSKVSPEDDIDADSVPDELRQFIADKALPIPNFLVAERMGRDPNRPLDVKNQSLMKGTTTLAFVFKGGVMMAADARASYQTGYLASNMVRKLIPINERIMGSMAGGAADCQFWQNWLSYRARVFELRTGERISVAAASKILADITFKYRYQGLSMGTMVTGVDESGFHLYRVDQQGGRSKVAVNSDGSGCLWAWSVLDHGYRFDLSVDEAVELARRAIFTAGHRDAFSGCRINVVHISADGWRWVKSEPFRQLQAVYDATCPPNPDVAPERNFPTFGTRRAVAAAETEIAPSL